jgi:glycosyltransferase involved in cell wall biosynthesis
MVAQYNLPVEFPGFVSLEELITLYRCADVFVGTGVDEPWGIRVNDAIQLGCPAIISNGMGAHIDVAKNRLGWVYPKRSARELAKVMRHLCEDRKMVQQLNHRVEVNQSLSPVIQANRLLGIIERRLGSEGTDFSPLEL